MCIYAYFFLMPHYPLSTSVCIPKIQGHCPTSLQETIKFRNLTLKWHYPSKPQTLFNCHWLSQEHLLQVQDPVQNHSRHLVLLYLQSCQSFLAFHNVDSFEECKQLLCRITSIWIFLSSLKLVHFVHL